MLNALIRFLFASNFASVAASGGAAICATPPLVIRNAARAAISSEGHAHTVGIGGCRRGKRRPLMLLFPSSGRLRNVCSIRPQRRAIAAGVPERARMSSLSDCTISDGDPWATRSSSNTRRCTRSSPPPFVPTQRLPSRSSSAPASGTQLSDVLHAPARIEHQELSNLSNGAASRTNWPERLPGLGSRCSFSLRCSWLYRLPTSTGARTRRNRVDDLRHAQPKTACSPFTAS
jgi:hypothetical protein